MNRTGIEWCDYTWNPVTGCLHGCPYCYARAMAGRFNGGDFTPKFHPERLDQPGRVKTPSKVFTGSVTDLGGDWVQPEWMAGVLDSIDRYNHHTYIVLSKNPGNLSQWFNTPRDNVWLGTSVDTADGLHRIDDVRTLQTVPIRFVSFEPLLGPVDPDLSGIDWVIIGAQTGPAILPQVEWVYRIVDLAQDAGAAVFMKDNLQGLNIPLIQHWPEVQQ